MKVAVEKAPKSRVQLRVEVPPDEVQPFLERAARELSKEHAPKGFRPGAVPFEVMRSAVGDQALVERALKEFVPRTYVQVLLDHEDLEAVGQPEVKVEAVALETPWVYLATVAVIPEVQLGTYQSIRAERRAVTVDDAEVQRELERLRKLRASYLTVPRGAQNGDRVDVTVSATVEQTPLDIGSPEKHPLILGESHFVPGFEQHLLGMREGEQKTFSLAFPENHHQSQLCGKTVEFTVTMGTVQQRVLPALDDAFARGLGKFSGLQQLTEQFTKNLREEKEAREQDRFQQDLLREVVAQATYGEFPDVLVERELDTMLAELKEGIADLGLSFEVYLSQLRKSPAELKVQWQPQALTRLRAGLALRAIAKAEKIAATDAEIQEEINGVLKQFPNLEEAKKRLDLDALSDLAAGTVRNRKVFTFLEGLANRRS
ncbi:MAG: trigger factor [Parcubacteria group bacterium Gr01-1014_38]|nr:MAG: trigger factor [Parcubacteria group bacterium Gr01-1014_38]